MSEGERGERGPRGVQGEPGKYEAIHAWRWRALTAWIIVFTLATILALRQNNDLSHQNKHRITEIFALQAQITKLSARRNANAVEKICHQQNVVKAALRALYKFELDEKPHTGDQRDRLEIGYAAIIPTDCSIAELRAH